MPASHDHAGLLQERKLGTPIVFVDRRAAFGDADSVIADNRSGIASAVAHLATYGHRRIAYLGDPASIWTAVERYPGYVEGMTAAGIPLEPALVRQDVRGVDAAEATTRDLFDGEKPPTAILAGQNLIGFDDFPLANLLDPPVTVVVQDAGALGRTAASCCSHAWKAIRRRRATSSWGRGSSRVDRARSLLADRCL